MLKTGKEDGYDIRKRFINDCIRLYETRYPEEAVLAKKSIRRMKKTRATVYGSDIQLELRFAVRLPTRLFNILSKLDDPPFLHEEKELVWFIKTFPNYSVAEKA